MKDNFYNEERIYHIFLIHDPYADTGYVGKTCAPNPQTRLSAHLRGECQLTEEAFLYDSIAPEAVEIRILESLVCTGSDAYRHVVAWCKYFKDNGGELLNAAGTIEDAKDLHPKTQAIYDTVCKPFSLLEVLTREVPLLQRGPESEIYESPQCCLSMRIPEDTRDAFKSFCLQNGLKQRDGLRLLLLSQEELDCGRLARSIQAELAKKDAEIAELEAKLEKKRDYIRRMRDRNVIVVEACQQFARGVISRLPAPATPKLKGMSFKTAKRRVDFSSYAYPSGSGCGYFTPEHLVYGKGVRAALFVLGHDATGKKVKFRWYDKDSYVGATFKWDEHACQGSFWLVGYTLAQDGAVDLVVAIPVDSAEIAAKEKSALCPAATTEHPSLDDIIKTAEGKKR